MYSGAIASNHGVKHIVSAFYLAKQAGVNIDEVRLKRAEERRKQREKLANLQTCTGGTFPRGGACVHYYNRENTINNATNTRNANMNYDDEALTEKRWKHTRKKKEYKIRWAGQKLR